MLTSFLSKFYFIYVHLSDNSLLISVVLKRFYMYVSSANKCYRDLPCRLVAVFNESTSMSIRFDLSSNGNLVAWCHAVRYFTTFHGPPVYLLHIQSPGIHVPIKHVFPTCSRSSHPPFPLHCLIHNYLHLPLIPFSQLVQITSIMLFSASQTLVISANWA